MTKTGYGEVLSVNGKCFNEFLSTAKMLLGRLVSDSQSVGLLQKTFTDFKMNK